MNADELRVHLSNTHGWLGRGGTVAELSRGHDFEHSAVAYGLDPEDDDLRGAKNHMHDERGYPRALTELERWRREHIG